MSSIAIVDGSLDLAIAEEHARALSIAACGGESVFQGRVRPDSDATLGALEAIEYEAYASMAEAAMREIAEDVCRETGCSGAVVLHSRGRVAVGEVSVIVWTAARHRAPAMEACSVIMDQLKASAPIWKREVFETGERWQGEPAPAASGEWE